MNTEQITVKGAELTLSLIIWRKHKRPMPGLVEATLDANPGMAALGPVLPVGYVFGLPIVEASAGEAVRDVIRLF